MIPVRSYSRMLSVLEEKEKHADFPVTVGILLADARREFCEKHILNYIEEYNFRLGRLLDLYLPGYYPGCRLEEPLFKLNASGHNFSPMDYSEARIELQKEGLVLPERTLLILAEYRNGRLRLKEKKTIVIDLEREYSEKKIDSVNGLISQLAEISRKTTEYEAFRKKYYAQKKGASVLHFIKAKLPGALWNMATKKI